MGMVDSNKFIGQHFVGDGFKTEKVLLFLTCPIDNVESL